MDTKKIILLVILAVILIALIIWVIWSNKALQLNGYTITSTRLPESFDGYRIAHISDLHNVKMGKNNKKLLDMLREAEPDIIAITGDLIDSRRTNVDIALEFAEEAVKIAPCYFVPGNHESRVGEYPELKKGLIAAGVTVLENDSAQITINGESITLMGVQDPSFQTDYLQGDSEGIIQESLDKLSTDGDEFALLLSHRPELFDIYANYGVDLVLTGHAHGGQVRIPWLGGVVAPNQGLFPKYDGGIYTQGDTSMLVSRGIGNSAFPFRVNNRPEVLLIELKSDK